LPERAEALRFRPFSFSKMALLVQRHHQIGRIGFILAFPESAAL